MTVESDRIGRRRRVVLWAGLTSLVLIVTSGVIIVKTVAERFACPSKSWEAAVDVELTRLIPTGATSQGIAHSDCDGRRVVEVVFTSGDPSALADVRSSAIALGWSEDATATDEYCYSLSVDGRATWISIGKRYDGVYRLAGGPYACP